MVAWEAGLAPQLDGVKAGARLVAEPGFGDAAWAAICVNAKYTRTLPGKGAIPATVVAAREQLVSLLTAELVEEEPRGGGDGGGPQPAGGGATAEWAPAARRWGLAKGANAPADMATVIAVLGDLLHDVHCATGRGIAHADLAFGLGQLAQQACTGDGSLVGPRLRPAALRGGIPPPLT
eukprot:5237979-Pleurochrysis_carterae.AAC.1